MLFLQNSLALAAILISFCASTPLIRVHNFSKERICYKVEYSNGTGAFPQEAVCDDAKGIQVGGFWLDPNQTKEVTAIGKDGQRFNGAITAVLKNNTIQGARNEINLLNTTMSWYDVDYQYGISDSTCGPFNSTNFSGERDALGKANAVWKTLNQTMKTELLAYPQYLSESNGSLVVISMGIDAWPSLAPKAIWFFQVTAGFKAYMSPGGNITYPKNSTLSTLQDLANKQTLADPSDHFLITSY